MLCRNAHCSERTLDRHAPGALGSTLREFLDLVRVLEAVVKVGTSDEKLDRIADVVGCSCSSVLQRSLRRHLGFTPREIRACVRAGLDIEACVTRGDVRERHTLVRKRLELVRKRHISALAPSPRAP